MAARAAPTRACWRGLAETLLKCCPTAWCTLCALMWQAERRRALRGLLLGSVLIWRLVCCMRAACRCATAPHASSVCERSWTLAATLRLSCHRKVTPLHFLPIMHALWVPRTTAHCASPSNRIFFKVYHHQMGCKQVGARLLKQTPDTLRRVLAPKVGGAANLACASLALPLAWSAAFSSVSALAGFSGHADYCAANAAADALALGAAARGPPALSVQWGAWSSVGARMHAP